MRYFLSIFLCIWGGVFLCIAEDSGAVANTSNKEVRKIPPELQIMIDRIKKLSEDEAFADMDRTIKMGNKSRLQVLLYVYPKLKNRQDTFGRTPLYNAVFAEQLELVKYLLSKRADFTTPDIDGDTPLHRAASDGSSDIIELLMKYGAHYYSKNKKERTPLFNAALHGEIEAARLLLKAGDRINRQDKYGDTPLHLAALKGSSKMVKFLLDNHADLTKKNKKGQTPADVARNAEIKKLLTK